MKKVSQLYDEIFKNVELSGIIEIFKSSLYKRGNIAVFYESITSY